MACRLSTRGRPAVPRARRSPEHVKRGGDAAEAVAGRIPSPSSAPAPSIPGSAPPLLPQSPSLPRSPRRSCLPPGSTPALPPSLPRRTGRPRPRSGGTEAERWPPVGRERLAAASSKKAEPGRRERGPTSRARLRRRGGRRGLRTAARARRHGPARPRVLDGPARGAAAIADLCSPSLLPRSGRRDLLAAGLVSPPCTRPPWPLPCGCL